MKGIIILLVITFSFSTASNSPGVKRHANEGEDTTLPCCEDVEVLECGMGVLWKVFMVLLALFLLLLLLGCLKGLLGLCCPFVSIWGLAVMTGYQHPSMCYYESQLAGHPVICDCDGLPYQSHTAAHSVHIYSRTTEFCLNVIFFLAFPIVLCCRCCKSLKKDDNGMCVPGCDPEKCYGSQLEEEDVRFVLEQLKRSRESFQRCMCDAAEQTPLLTDRNLKWEVANQAFSSSRQRALQNQMTSEACANECTGCHSDLSNSRWTTFTVTTSKRKQCKQHLL